RRSPRPARAGAGDARRHRAVPGVRRRPGRQLRAPPRARAGPAHRARVPAPAGVRPRRAGRGARDVRAAERTPGRVVRPARQRAGRGLLSVDDTLPMAVAAVLLIPVAGLFAALDSALSTVSVARVEEMAKDSRYGARRLSRMLEGRARYINVAVLLHSLCLLAAAVLFTVVFTDVIGSTGWALTTAILVTTVATYVVAGVGPRTLGRQHAYSLSLFAATPMRIVGTVLGPVATLLLGVGNAVTPGGGFRNGPFASEIELLEIVDMARERGGVADGESRMIQSVVELGGTTAREVMTPRPEMVWIEVDKTVGQASRLAVRSGYSRIPVVGENADDVVGVLCLPDLVARHDPPHGRPAAVSAVRRPAMCAPDAKRTGALLAEMQRAHNHLAVLVDGYGGIAGLVSIEDLLEEIVREIVDEYDTTEV